MHSPSILTASRLVAASTVAKRVTCLVIALSHEWVVARVVAAHPVAAAPRVEADASTVVRMATSRVTAPSLERVKAHASTVDRRATSPESALRRAGPVQAGAVATTAVTKVTSHVTVLPHGLVQAVDVAEAQHALAIAVASVVVATAASVAVGVSVIVADLATAVVSVIVAATVVVATAASVAVVVSGIVADLATAVVSVIVVATVVVATAASVAVAVSGIVADLATEAATVDAVVVDLAIHLAPAHSDVDDETKIPRRSKSGQREMKPRRKDEKGRG